MKLSFNKPAGLLIALLFSALPAGADTATRARFLMGTVCEITAHGPDAGKAIEAAFGEIARLDAAMSLYKDDSELSTLNRRAAVGPTPCSKDLFEALHLANEVYRFSNGAFDPTVRKGLPAPGFSKVKLYDNEQAAEFLEPGVSVSLDAIGKGFALDVAARALEARGVTSAILNFGGQVLALGAPPGLKTWGVEVAGASVIVQVKDRSVATSSQQEQPGHLLDPRTGRAAPRKGAVTVIAADGARADAWATALFVLGAARPPKGFDGCAFETVAGRIVARSPGCRPYFAGKTTKEKAK